MTVIMQEVSIIGMMLTILLMLLAMTAIIYLLYRVIMDQRGRRTILEEHMPNLTEKINEINNAVCKVLLWQAFSAGRGKIPEPEESSSTGTQDSQESQSEVNRQVTSALPPQNVMEEFIREYSIIRRNGGKDQKAIRDFRSRWQIDDYGIANKDDCWRDHNAKGRFARESNGDLWCTRFHPRDRSLWVVPAPQRNYNFLMHLTGRWRDVFDVEPPYDNKSEFSEYTVEAAGQFQIGTDGNADVVEKGKINLA